MTKTILSVPDVSCEHCERTIKGALEPLDGIHLVEVNIPAHLVTVEYDDASIGLARIEEALLAEDYPVAHAH